MTGWVLIGQRVVDLPIPEYPAKLAASPLSVIVNVNGLSIRQGAGVMLALDVRGNSHYGRTEAMEWCDENGVGYIFGFAGNSVLDALVAEAADHLRFWHALTDAPKSRCYKALKYKAGSWSMPRRIITRNEVSMHPNPTSEDPQAMRQQIDVHYVMTSLHGDPERLYERVNCQQGQAENLIKLH